MAHTSTPKAMRIMLSVTPREYFSVPSITPDAYTRPGMRDLVIWMNDTDRYR